jgi:hypothetical protein
LSKRCGLKADLGAANRLYNREVGLSVGVNTAPVGARLITPHRHQAKRV